eukprot:TRINITY_DN2497_c1_g1_i5.p1 TRINITY_DN2497_c1_g1~~TRINITY_DN2497_c1_g1_i5.p1  ORF type:complete len:731 (+),score=167.23 TRINITY_DN2497_c1_g1_i5:156-2348(+)
METAAIVLGCAAGIPTTGFLFFYAAKGRLPHALPGLLQLPPVFKAGTQNAANSLQLLSIPLMILALTPLVACIALYAVVLVEADPPPSSYDVFDDVVQCATAATREWGLSTTFVSRHNIQLDPQRRVVFAETLRDTQALTNKLCDRSKLPGIEVSHRGVVVSVAQLAPLIAEARRVVSRAADPLSPLSTSQRFSETSEAYAGVAQLLVMLYTEALRIDMSLSERLSISENAAYQIASAASEDCGIVSQAVRLEAVSRRWPVFLPGGVWRDRAVHEVFGNLYRIATTEEHYVDPAVYPSAYPYENGLRTALLSEVVARMKNGTNSTGLAVQAGYPNGDTSQGFQEGLATMSVLYGATEKRRLLSAHGEEDHRQVYIATASVSMGLVCAALLACVTLFLRHAWEVGWEIRILRDFDDSRSSMAHLQHIVQRISSLRLEGIADADSSVENCFIAYGRKVLDLKPFVSHSLYEGHVEADQGHDVSMGRVAVHSVRHEAGMCFTTCSIMCVSLHMFNGPLGSEALQSDLLEDFNSLVGLVLSTVSRHQGVVHNVNSFITCTFNVSILTEANTSQLAVACARELSEIFDHHQAQGTFAGIPDEPLRIGIASGDVMNGLLGLYKRHALTIGRPVLLAQRMAAMAESGIGEILLDTQTKQSVDEHTMPQALCHGELVHVLLDEPSDRPREYNEGFAHVARGDLDKGSQGLRLYLSKERHAQDKTTAAFLEHITSPDHH